MAKSWAQMRGMGVPVTCGNVRQIYRECRDFHDKLAWDMVSSSDFAGLDAQAREFLMERMRRPCAKLAKVAKRCAKEKKR